LDLILELSRGCSLLYPLSFFIPQVLSILVEVHQTMSDEDRDFAAELHCLQQLDNAPAAAKALKSLLKGAPALGRVPLNVKHFQKQHAM